MAGSGLSEQAVEGIEPLAEQHDEMAQAERHESDLRSLLTTIVEQIAEADRRNSETLQQLQERLADLGRDTQAIKPRLPHQFAPAFERIEAGVAELAARISEAAEQRITNPEQASVDFEHGAIESAHTSEIADALKPHATKSDEGYGNPYNARDYGHPPGLFGTISHFDDDADALRSHGDAPVHRPRPDVDTFDIIESDPPAGSDPWDRETADALTGIHHDDATSFAFDYQLDDDTAASPAPSDEAADYQNNQIVADKRWLEERFAEIAQHIEQSLSDIRPDQGFFALNQRVDEFEENFAAAIHGIARGGDTESMQAIGDHVTNLAGQLETTHSRLQRLDEIEQQLAIIAAKLEDVHHAATVSLEGGDGAAAIAVPAVDFDAVARTAAEAAAAEISKHKSSASDTSELSTMLHDFMAEQRRGDENTAALLDTLQQAMIRLLDRVDHMESGEAEGTHLQHQSFASPAGNFHSYHGAEEFIKASQQHADHVPELETVAAAVAAEAKERASVVPPVPPALEQPTVDASTATDAISPEKIRQDFIAEARRAKMRLSSGEAAEEAADAGTESPIALRNKVRSSAVATEDANEKSVAATNNSRLRIIALATMLALGGAYLTVQSGIFSGGETASTSVAPAASSESSPAAAPAGATAPDAGNGAPALDPELKGVAPIGKQGAVDPSKPEGTEGTITTDDIVVGSTSVPLYGVAVDTQNPVTAEGLEMARRRQAMANVSSQLGVAAVHNGTATAMPAALHTDSNATAATESAAIARTVTGATDGGPLDLPPATVGPLSLRLAAANGDPSAQFEVGSRLAEGSGTEQTFKDAAKWYQRAATQGLAQAQYRLGTLYERGLGLRKDQARAEDWYRRAADQGNVKAMHNLAVLRTNASHGSPDYMSAAQWFEKAAERGLADSQFNLAVLEENGLGVPKDMVAAYKWMALAAKSGDSEAIRRRDILKGKLTAEQLQKAEASLTAFRLKRPDPSVNDAFKAGEAWKRNPANGLSG